jgi:phosphohistidine phosphatase
MPRREGFLLIVRHGKAEDAHTLGDSARALTEEGRQALRQHAATLAMETTLEGIATSPLVRAVQTAEILAEAFEVKRVPVRSELDPDLATARAIEQLALSLGPGWALVGHNPSLAEAVAHMLRQSGATPRLRKGAVVALRLPQEVGGQWELAWSAAPGRKPSSVLE